MNIVNVEKLVELRKKNRLNQSELARAVGVTRFAINSIEKGRFSPGLSLLVRLSEVLHCKVDDLIFFNQNVDFKSTLKEGVDVADSSN